MANNAKNVTVGKPKVGGAIFVAPEGTALPSDATTKLAAAFKDLGYASDDGFKKSIERSTEEAKAWGGDIVLNTQTEYKETYTVTLIEALNVEVLKAVYGEDNVKGTNGVIKVSGNSKELNTYVWAIDTVFTGDIPSRLVIPHGKITEVGEVTYEDGEAVAYEITISATPDTDGNSHYEYIGKASA